MFKKNCGVANWIELVDDGARWRIFVVNIPVP